MESQQIAPPHQNSPVPVIKHEPALPIRRIFAFIFDTLFINFAVIIPLVTQFILALGWIFYGSSLEKGDTTASTQKLNTFLENAFRSTDIIFFGILLLCFFLYFFLPQWKWNKTLGQKIFGIQIHSKKGKHPTFIGTSVRVLFPLLLQSAILIPVPLQYVGLLLIIIDCGWYFYRPGKQTLHDFLSQTVVVNK